MALSDRIVTVRAFGKQWNIHQRVIDECGFLRAALEWRKRSDAAGEDENLLGSQALPNEQQFNTALSFLYGHRSLPESANLEEYREVGLFLGIDSLVEYVDRKLRLQAGQTVVDKSTTKCRAWLIAAITLMLNLIQLL